MLKVNQKSVYEIFVKLPGWPRKGSGMQPWLALLIFNQLFFCRLCSDLHNLALDTKILPSALTITPWYHLWPHANWANPVSGDIHWGTVLWQVETTQHHVMAHFYLELNKVSVTVTTCYILVYLPTCTIPQWTPDNGKYAKVLWPKLIVWIPRCQNLLDVYFHLLSISC